MLLPVVCLVYKSENKNNKRIGIYIIRNEMNSTTGVLYSKIKTEIPNTFNNRSKNNKLDKVIQTICLKLIK